MKKKKSWKHILEYELGVLILVAVLLVAWFGPDLYASWQDQSQNGKVVCSSRDEIRFLDTDSLDIAGRMVLLRDATYLNWYENDVYYDGSRMTQEEIEQLLIQRPRSLAEQWVEAGVMPAQFVRQIPRTLQEADVLEEGTSSGIYSVVVDQNVLNVLVLNYVKSADVYGSPSLSGLCWMRTRIFCTMRHSTIRTAGTGWRSGWEEMQMRRMRMARPMPIYCIAIRIRRSYRSIS